MRRFLPCLAALLALACGAPLRAQQASAFVPPQHWSIQAVDRVHALGLAPGGTFRGERSRTIAETRRVLAHAAQAESSAPAWSALARDWLARFDEEFGTDSTARAALTHAAAAGGAGTIEGDVGPGRQLDYLGDWSGARPRPDRTRAAGEAALSLRLGDHLAAGAAASVDARRSRLDEAYGVLRTGPLAAWGGRRQPGFGSGTSGVTLAGTAPIDGGGLFFPEPVRLPWILRHLGPVRLDITVGVLGRNGFVDQPWFLSTRGAFELHPRFGVGVTRGAMIGAVEGGMDVTDLLYVFIGGQANGSEYDNQVVSVDGWYRPPLGSLPLLLYLDWGAEDQAGAWWDVPGIVAGAEIAAVPGVPALSLLVERASFGRSGFVPVEGRNPPWYRHPIGFLEGWTSRGELLGHPLGGHGEEWLVQARTSTHAAGLQLALRAFSRRRGEENLFAPERGGRSQGASVAADVRIARGVGARVAGSIEDGERDWRRSELRALLRFYAPR